MKSINLKKYSFLVLILFLLEIGFSCLLAGGFTLICEQLTLLLNAILITCLMALFTPPRKNILTIGLPLLFAISSLSIKLLAQESLTMRDIIKYMGFCTGVYVLLMAIGLFITRRKIRNIYYTTALLLFLLPFGALLFYYGTSGSWIHADTIMAILQSNVMESQSYLKDNLTATSLISLLVILALLTTFTFSIRTLPTRSLCSLRNKKSIALCTCFLLTTVFLVVHCKKNVLTDIFKDSAQYMQKYNEFAKNKATRKAHLKKFALTTNPAEKGVYVLIIGESQNRLHMNAYGYERNTTPWLTAQKENKNFLLFDHAFSCHTHTVPVLTYALTAKNQYNNQLLENAVSIIEMAQSAGYKTVWLSNQVRYGAWDTPISVIASEADQQIWINRNIGETTRTNCYDGVLAEKLKSLSYTDKMLIVIHLMGNHGVYADRYPLSFEQFHGKGKRIDSYDNSILYNDSVMSQIYEAVQTIPHFQSMIYFSDHSEAADQGLGHDSSNFIWPMTYIPFYMAFSSDYEKTHPETYQTLQNHTSAYFTNDLIFNTLMGIMHIRANDFYESENDISSSAYDTNASRFMTLYGKRKIIEHE